MTFTGGAVAVCVESDGCCCALALAVRQLLLCVWSRAGRATPTLATLLQLCGYLHSSTYVAKVGGGPEGRESWAGRAEWRGRERSGWGEMGRGRQAKRGCAGRGEMEQGCAGLRGSGAV